MIGSIDNSTQRGGGTNCDDWSEKRPHGKLPMKDFGILHELSFQGMNTDARLGILLASFHCMLKEDIKKITSKDSKSEHPKV